MLGEKWIRLMLFRFRATKAQQKVRAENVGRDKALPHTKKVTIGMRERNRIAYSSILDAQEKKKKKRRRQSRSESKHRSKSSPRSRSRSRARKSRWNILILQSGHKNKC